ncbi:zinc finger protein 648 [Tamandua tetradactyla]|uniref:zinc finger protein 648 n=1 Tax=Tamandua tetradactyla TaxID=48850 RepID=UPI00405407B5
MAHVELQDTWGTVAPLGSLTEEAQDSLMLSMNLESEDEDGGEVGDKGGTGDHGHQNHPRGSPQVTQDNRHLPGQNPQGKEEKSYDSFSAGDVGKKQIEIPEKASGGRDESKSSSSKTLTCALQHKRLGPTHPLRDSQPPGYDEDRGAKLDAPLGVPFSFPGMGRYGHESGDTSPDSSSPLCLPKPGNSWGLPTQQTHTPAGRSPTPATLAGITKARAVRKGQNPEGSGKAGQGEARLYKRLRAGRAFQEPSHPRSPAESPTSAKPHACELCGKAYSHRGTLQQHRRLHTGERPYQCPFCDKTYTWSSDHRKHIRTHTGEKPYRCPDCGKAFVRSSDLRKHQRNMHDTNRPFPCAECGQTFNKPLSLLRHQRSHLGAKPFRCSACDRTFAVASRMVEHQRVHSGERPFPCPTCGKCFTKSSNLSEHQTLHTGQRPFKCADCGVAFAQPSRLVRHQRMHTGERPFPCPQCGQAFARASTLKRHQQVHSGEKGFLCAQCGRAFRVASELTQHIRAHSGERPYQCGDCGQAFTRSNHLQRHRAKHGICEKEPIPSSSDA